MTARSTLRSAACGMRGMPEDTTIRPCPSWRGGTANASGSGRSTQGPAMAGSAETTNGGQAMTRMSGTRVAAQQPLEEFLVLWPQR